MDMAMDFMDIRKRVYTFPKMGEKAYFVAIPTTAGSGSEVTPFAVITDDVTGKKWPLADYELLPNMAIVDVDNMMEMPKGLDKCSRNRCYDTCAGGLCIGHGVGFYRWPGAEGDQDWSSTICRVPMRTAQPTRKPERRWRNASCIAGMAFANAFLGVNHSLAHKLGAFHHLPHGVANALVLTDVIHYNAEPAPAKMGTFPQYKYPHAFERYVEAARFAGITGKDDQEVFENLIQALEDLKEKIGIKKTIADYGVTEQDFLATLDEMSEQAFDDQCTGANPRYPLISELKEIYRKAYYGK